MSEKKSQSVFSQWEKLDDASAFDYSRASMAELESMEVIAKQACRQAYSIGNNRLRFLEERKRSGLDAIRAEKTRRLG